MIDSIIQRLLSAMETIGYPGLALAMFLESFFAPIPSELILPFGWWLAAQGKMHLVWVIIVSGVFAYLGSLPFYLIGYWGNRNKINTFVGKYGKYLFITPEDTERWFALFERFGAWFVFFGRLIPIVRTVVSFPAGAVKMPFWKFSILTLIGSTLWSLLLIGAWYILGDNYTQVQVWMEQYQHIIEPILVLIIVGWIVHIVYKRFFTR